MFILDILFQPKSEEEKEKQKLLDKEEEFWNMIEEEEGW